MKQISPKYPNPIDPYVYTTKKCKLFLNQDRFRFPRKILMLYTVFVFFPNAPIYELKKRTFLVACFHSCQQQLVILFIDICSLVHPAKKQVEPKTLKDNNTSMRMTKWLVLGESTIPNIECFPSSSEDIIWILLGDFIQHFKILLLCVFLGFYFAMYTPCT